MVQTDDLGCHTDSVKMSTAHTSRRSRRKRNANENVVSGRQGLLRIFDLSGKPLETILHEVLTDGDATLVPSTSRIKVYNKRQTEPNVTFKTGCRRLFPLIGASKVTRDRTYEYLGKQLTFFEEDSDNLLFRKPYMSKKLLANIRKIKVCMGFGIRCRSYALWPRYIDLFTKEDAESHSS